MLPAPDRMASLNRLMARFRHEEDGTISIFVAILFTLMIMMGGFAVDLMRTEYVRTSLQQSLDRCTLASAALNQELDPETVCRDYVAKAGHSDDLTAVHVSEGLNFREVSVDAVAVEQPFFAQMVGIDQFDIPSASMAEQRITDIEIAMVLDVSGSMIQTPSRITNLRTAAKEFVQTVLETDAEQRTSIAIVPFNGQVMLGPLLTAKFNVNFPNGNANMTCVDLPPAGFTTPGLSQTLMLPQSANSDTFSGTGGAGQSTGNPSGGYVAWNNSSALPRIDHAASPIADNRWCPPFAGNQIRLPGNNIGQLQGFIDGLVPVGATSINAGMRWGLALLDPAARPMYTEFVNATQMPAPFNGRPFDYMPDGTARPDMMKVVVLMTDGEHFAEERVSDDFKWRTTGSAPLDSLGTIWRATSDSNYSRFIQSRVDASTATTLCNSRPFWVPHLGVYHSRPWNGTAPSGTACYAANVTTTTTGVTLQTWPQVLAAQRASWVAWQLYGRPAGNSTAVYHEVMGNTNNDAVPGIRTRTPTTTMDTQLQQVCDMARDRNVIVFGIAFEAPANGKTQIEQCSSSPAHYYDVAGVDIRTAFRSIAAQISQLRLMQ